MIETFAAELRGILPKVDDATQVIDVRLLPFGVTVDRPGGPVRFDAGSVAVPSATIPLTIDHASGTLLHVGKLISHLETADGLYGRLQISETAAGSDVYQLLADGVIGEISAGVLINETSKDPSGVTLPTGQLHHVSVVPAGAFGQDARVLAVHAAEEGESTMDDNKTTETETKVVELAQFGDRFDTLEKLVAALSVPGAKEEPERKEFADTRAFVMTLAAAQSGDREAQQRIARFALADDTTTTAAGVVPDYLSTKVIEIVNTRRPYVDALPKDPAGDHGMSVVYPKVTVEPEVDVQAAEKTEVASQAMTIVPESFDLDTYAGASDVSRQLIERSQPSFVDILYRHYAKQYAKKTDGAAVAAGVAAAPGAVLADLGADGAATFAAVNAGNAAIIAGSEAPATHWALGADRWTQLNSLVDADGRPILVYPANNPSNAAGQSGFPNTTAQYHGLVAFLDVNAGAADALLFNEEFAASVEADEAQMRAEVVSLLGFELGVYGLFAPIVKIPAAGFKFTAV